jgi:UDP-N-acetylglucosamine 1-carboxyvinyltransferase
VLFTTFCPGWEVKNKRFFRKKYEHIKDYTNNHQYSCDHLGFDSVKKPGVGCWFGKRIYNVPITTRGRKASFHLDHHLYHIIGGQLAVVAYSRTLMSIYLEGKNPLRGSVQVSGAKNSAIKLIFASMFSNEDVVLDNVPRIESILIDLEIIKSIGGKAEWIGKNRLLLNGSNLVTHEIPYELGAKYRTAFLLVGPLLYKFGKAQIPQTAGSFFRPNPINRILATWQSLGFDIKQDETWIYISTGTPKASEISFKTTTHTGTENAILSALFIDGETIINNASEEPEIDDLISFVRAMGVTCERVEPRKIRLVGSTVFRGTTFTVQPDKYEAAAFATAALLSKGNIAITGINKLPLVPFVNFLTKIKANFDIQFSELRVWDTNHLEPTNLTIAPSPGFIPDWQPLATLILSKATGTSLVHDTVYTDKFGYVKDLNRMGTDIEVVKPSTVGLMAIISDDAYDYEQEGEPSTVAKIVGPAKFTGAKFHISDPRYANTLVLAALGAEGKTEINGYISAFEETENFFDKLISLGAKITRDEIPDNDWMSSLSGK